MSTCVIPCNAVTTNIINFAFYCLAFFWCSSFQFMHNDISMFVYIYHIIVSNLSMIWFLTASSWIKRSSIQNNQFFINYLENFCLKFYGIFFVIKRLSTWDPLDIKNLFLFGSF